MIVMTIKAMQIKERNTFIIEFPTYFSATKNAIILQLTSFLITFWRRRVTLQYDTAHMC